MSEHNEALRDDIEETAREIQEVAETLELEASGARACEIRELVDSLRNLGDDAEMFADVLLGDKDE